MRKPRDPKSTRTAKLEKLASDSDSGEIAPETGPEADIEAQAIPDADPVTETVTESVTETEADPDADPVIDTETMAEAVAADELAPEDPPHDDHVHDDAPQDAEHGHRSLAATALMILVGVIIIASLTLWAAPKLAPHLPASVAQYLLPGQMDTAGRLASLDDTLAAETAKANAAIAALNEEIAGLTGRLDAAADAGQSDTSETDAAIAAAQSAAAAAAANAASLTTQLGTIETELTSLRDEFAAVSTALADAGTGEGATSAEISAAVAALGARLDGLAAAVEDSAASDDLEARIAALTTRLEAAESSAADARDVQSEALGEVSSAIREARLQSAVDVLASRLTGGLYYAAKLDEIVTLTGTEPPEALAAGAETGLATAAALEASFGRHAQAAVAADVQASAGDGSGLQALGWLKAQVAGRPTNEIEGDSVGAVTSRIAARVEEGKLAEALAEAKTLPDHAQAGLGDWLDQLRTRVSAETALAEWRTQIGAGG